MIAPLSIPSPDPGLRGFTIPLPWGGLEIRTYAICILAGIVIAVWLTSRRLTKRGAEPWITLDIAIWTVVFGIIGARIYHVLTHPADYFAGQDFLKIFAINEGGIAIYGAFIGGAIGAWIGCRISGIRLFTFLDALAPGLLLAQAAGRFGNYFNHELFGSPTDLPWGLEIESTNPAFPVGLAPGTLFQPTFLYEVVWNVIGALLIIWISRHFHVQWGRIFALYLIWQGIGRSYFESIRLDPSEIFFGIRVNVWASFASIILGVIIWIIQGRRHRAAEPGPYRDGRIWDANSEVDVELEDFAEPSEAVVNSGSAKDQSATPTKAS